MAPSNKAKKGSSAQAALTAMKAKMLDLQKRIKEMQERNVKLVNTVNTLNLDKAELQSKLEAEQKRKGGSIVSSESEQLKLVDGMQSSVRNLVQQKFFVHWPFLDKAMFSQGNLITPAAAYLRIEDHEVRKYEVDIRRVCIAKTTYWRGYCGDQVRKEYISKSV